MVKIMQLYRSHIPEDLIIRVVKCFGFESLDSEYMFSKADLSKNDTVTKVLLLREELIQYYLPCKARLYLNNININKCITILRQILKLNGMHLVSKQKYIKYKKTTLYYLERKDDDKNIHSLKVDNQLTTVTFS